MGCSFLAEAFVTRFSLHCHSAPIHQIFYPCPPPHIRFQGTLVGLEHTCFALAGMVGPGLGVALLQHPSFGLGGIAAGAAAVFTGLFLFWKQDGGGEATTTTGAATDDKCKAS